MFRFIALLSCFVVVLAGRKDPLDDRVLGGQPAAVGQFPYQASMRWRTGGHTCGGSILTSRHVLTAAHCVYQHYFNEFIVVVGAIQLSSGGQSYELEAAVYHSGYNPQTQEHDIAILKTSSDIAFNALVQPIPLQTTGVPDGAPMVLSGWGLTTWPGTGAPDNLQWANLVHLNINQCMQSMQPNQIFLTQICTFTRPGQGACHGDSGGPLVYAGHLAGIVSWGRPCAVGYPDVFTRVESYVDWIIGFINMQIVK